MVAVIWIMRRRGLKIEEMHTKSSYNNKLAFISYCFYYKSSLRQLYMLYFGGCSSFKCLDTHTPLVSRYLKEKLAWAIDKWHWVVNNIRKIVIPLKNKAIKYFKFKTKLWS